MAATIFRYDNAGNAKGILPYDRATHEESLDGIDKLTVVSEVNPTKRDRLVWRDDSGTWHEHLVDAVSRTHGANGARTESTCSNSINELYGVIADGTKLKASVHSILASLLDGTRWSVGSCSDFGIVTLEVYRKSVRECIAELCELCKGELVTAITADDSGVIGRTARIVHERGNKAVIRQFQFGRNVSSILREVSADEVYTAVKGYGAKLSEDDRSKYPDRLEVTVESTASLDRWGVPNGDGTFAHNYVTYTDAQCTDATFLARQCKRILASVSKPLVRYEFETADLGGSLWTDVRLGDKVMCVDELFDPPLELIERVSQIRRNLRGRVQCRIAIGARPNPLVRQYKAAEKTSRTSTGNGTRISGYTPPTTYGAGYDGEGAAEIGDPDVPTGDEPTRIAVTTLPTKTAYFDGETIDYAGIVVTLYNADGSLYTDEWHPDGAAAFDELTFPVEQAYFSQGKGGEYSNGDGINALRTSYSDEPYVYPSGFETHYYIGNRVGTHDEYGDVFVVAVNDNQKANNVQYVTEYDGELYIANVAPGPDNGSYLGYFTDMLYWGGGTTGAGGWQKSTLLQPGFHVGGIPVSAVKPTGDGSDLQQVSSSSDIPVQWTEPNSGRVLETTFKLTVNLNPYYNGEAWGGGEGVEVPASSGGGKF